MFECPWPRGKSSAIITHLRVRDYSIGPAAAFLLLAVAALVLGLVS